MHKAKQKWLLALGVLLIVLTAFSFETNSTTTSTHYDGPKQGAALAILTGVILLFKLVRLWADILVDRGTIAVRPKFYFDWLILAVLVIPSVGYAAAGEYIITATGESKPSWLFRWGTSEGKDAYILSVIALALLLRVYAVTRAILDTKPGTNHKPNETKAG